MISRATNPTPAHLDALEGPPSRTQSELLAPLLGLAGLIVLAVYSSRNYLLFHTVVEMASIGVAFAVFAFGWNSRRYTQTGHVLLLGVGYLFVGLTDLLHTLAYEGMGVFATTGPNLATQLWIAARYQEAAVLVAVPLLIGRRVKPSAAMLLGAAVFAALVLSILRWKIFPDCFVTELTAFKILSEFAVCLVLLAAIALTWRRRKRLDRYVVRLLTASAALTILSEFAFTLYRDSYGYWNMTGHLLKVASFYLIYKAVIEAGFTRPYGVLFHGIMERDRALTKSQESLEARVVERTAALGEANRSLQQEVAKHKRTAAALYESERRYRLLVEQIPAVTFAAPINPEDGRVYVSPQVRKLLGFEPEDFEASHEAWFSRIHPDDREAARRHAKACDKAGSRCKQEYRMVTRDGRVIWVAEESVAIEGEDGRLHLQGVVYDDTQRRWADQAAAEIKRLHYTSAVADTVPLPLVTLDERLKILYANRTYYEAFRTRPEEVEGKNLAEVSEGCWDDPRVARAARHALSGAKGREHIVVEASFPALGHRIMRVSPQRLFRESNQAPQLLLAIEDITEETEIQARLMRTERLAALGQLAGGVAHELRNPLSAVRSGAYLLRMALDPTGGDVAEALDIIEREVGKSDRIITNLLDYGRDKRLAKQKTSLNEIARNAVADVAIPKNIRVETDWREDLPWIMADPEQLGQVLTNLVTNAVAAMPHGGTLRVRTEAREGGRVAAVVSDTGKGISPKDLRHLFEPLFTTRTTGIGLGLAVSKGIVGKHGGTIRVRSREGEGSEFTVELPVAPAEEHLAAETREGG